MRDEIGLAAHTRGAVGISTRGRDTGDAQIFINLVDNPRLDFEYTVFGYVNPNDLDIVDGIAEGDAIDTIKFDKATTEEKAPPPEGHAAGDRRNPVTRQEHRRAFLRLMLAGCVLPSRGFARQDKGVTTAALALDAKTGGYHVHPNGRIQDALEAAARDPVDKKVYVHAGTYRPRARGQALIWFNARHDGITLEAVGDVTLTAANPEIADRHAPSYPAVVNHVVYFGDGVSRNTVLRGFQDHRREQLHHRVRRQVADRIGRHAEDAVLLRRRRRHQDLRAVLSRRSSRSRSPATTPAPAAAGCRSSTSIRCRSRCSSATASSATTARRSPDRPSTSCTAAAPTIENCLFAGNLANLGVDYVGMLSGGEYHPEHGSGALTVFERSRVTVSRCTFTGNWNGVDDDGTGSTYVDSIFWKNTLPGGISPGPRYELDIVDAAGVRGSFIHGDVNDLRRTIDPKANTFDPPDPRFDAHFVAAGAAIRRRRVSAGQQAFGVAGTSRLGLLFPHLDRSN